MTTDQVRLLFFVGIFAAMASWEFLSPALKFQANKKKRWARNLSITFLSTLAIKFVSPLTAIGFAHLAEDNSWGLFHNTNSPTILTFVFCILFLDLAIYFQHRVFHFIPLLWRLHRVHHMDEGFDVTTGARFHPIEILLSVWIKGALILALGAPPDAVLIFEIILNVTAMFNHSNVFLPTWLEPFVQKIIVTPDMHRVHHSQAVKETNSNFGFSLSLWDRIFKTHIEGTREKSQTLNIGLSDMKDKEEWAPAAMLLNPFK